MWFIGSKQQYYSKVFAKKKKLTQDDVKVVLESEPISFRFAKNVPLLSQSIKFICTATKKKISSITPQNRSSSLARNVAISGIDLYEKYSPANYTPKTELNRASSLSDSSSLQHSTTTSSVNNNKDSSPVVGLNKVIRASPNSAKENNNNNPCCDANNKSNVNSRKNKSSTSNNNNCLCHHHHPHCKHHHPSSSVPVVALSTSSVLTSSTNNPPHISNNNNNNNNTSLKTNQTAKNIQEQSLRHTTARNKSATHTPDITTLIKSQHTELQTKPKQYDSKKLTRNADRTSNTLFDHRHSHTARSSSCSSALRRQSSQNSASDNNNSMMPSYTHHSAPVQGKQKLNYSLFLI